MATVTNSIGTASRDYSTIALWEAALPASAVTAGNSYVGQCYNDSEFDLSTTQTVIGGTTTDATHTITLTTAAGQGFKDNGSAATNGLRYNASNGVAITGAKRYGQILSVTDNFVTLQNLQIRNSDTNCLGAAIISGTDSVSDGCIFQSFVASDGACVDTGLSASRAAFKNSLFIADSASGLAGIRFNDTGSAINCTVVKPSNRAASGTGIKTRYAANTVQNCAVAGFTTAIATAAGTFSGSGNAIDTGSYPSGLTGQTSLTIATEFENPSNASSVMDWRLKSTSVACKDNGTNSGAPTTDIIGQAISNTTRDVGAWELQQGGGASVGSAAGTGSATAAGQSTASSAGNSAGTGTATAVGKSTAVSVGSAAGTGAAAGVGGALLPAAGAAAGVGAASAVGLSTAASVGASAGVGAASGVGQSTAASVGASAGSGTASGVGLSTAVAVGAAAGIGAASGAAVSPGNAGLASGVGAATADGLSNALATGSATGTGAASGVGASNAAAVGSSAGTGSASSVGKSIFIGVGSAVGVGAAVGVPVAGSIGAAFGTGAAFGVGTSIAVAVGFASGVGTASGFSSSISILTNPLERLKMYTGTLGTVSNREDWIVNISFIDNDGVALDISTAQSIVTYVCRQGCPNSPVLSASLTDKIVLTDNYTMQWAFPETDMQNLCASQYDVFCRVEMNDITTQILSANVAILEGGPQ